jgi:hypothetical protein
MTAPRRAGARPPARRDTGRNAPPALDGGTGPTARRGRRRGTPSGSAARGAAADPATDAESPRGIEEAVRTLCLSLPEAVEIVSHGAPAFRAGKGRLFAMYAVNHHGDGRVALWLPAAPGSQVLHVERDPDRYFVPPYVGPRGWLGVHLDRGLDWTLVAARIREAFVHVAPARLAARAGEMPRIAAPPAALPAEAVDPLSAPRARAVHAGLASLCGALPGTSEARRFGEPAFRVGTRTFCTLALARGRLAVGAWVGGEGQAMLTFDGRYRVPPYIGRFGWILLDADDGPDWREVCGLVLGSYRHYAPRRLREAATRLAGDGTLARAVAAAASAVATSAATRAAAATGGTAGGVARDVRTADLAGTGADSGHLPRDQGPAGQGAAGTWAGSRGDDAARAPRRQQRRRR